MRQENGTELLGLNDPRSASIGIIHVSANDSRKSVLAAILTQEKLGRKQAVVVLSPQNKVFQRQIDFDELQRVQSKLQTSISFIASVGSRPAKFARQHRFSVYSSLDNYANFLRGERQVNAVRKKHGLPADARSQAGQGNGKDRADIADPQQVQQIAPIEGKKSSEVPGVPIVIGSGAVVAADAMIHASRLEQNGASTPFSQSDEKPLSPIDATPISPRRTVPIDATPIASPPGRISPRTESGVNGLNRSNATNTNASEGNGPGIIELPGTGAKPTRKLPEAAAPAATSAVSVVPLVPSASPPTPLVPAPANKVVKPRSTSKIAAIGAAGTMAAMGRGAPPVQTARAGGGGTYAGGNAGSGGGGGNPKRRRGILLTALAALLVAMLVIVAASAYAKPNLFNPLSAALAKVQGQSTVTITPISKLVSNSYVLVGVTTTPNSAQHEVSARVLSASAPAQSKTVSATGVNQTSGTHATGTLTFFNGSNSSYTFGTNTPITATDGTVVFLDTSVVVPAANPPTEGSATGTAHAANVGTAGNIPAGDINTVGSFITIKNPNAFSGGQDPQNYTYVQQSDINGAVNALEPGLVQQAQAALKPQIHSNEQFAGSAQCTPSVSSNESAGAQVSSVTVTVSATCKTLVYNQQQATSLAISLLTAQATTNPGSDYALAGSIGTQTTIQSANLSQGNVSLLVNAKGQWVYNLTSARAQQLKQLIAGKSDAVAITLLKSQRGISDASIQPTGTTLPTNLSLINITVQSVSGLGGGGATPTPGSMTTPTVTVPGASPTSVPGLGSSGS